MKNEEIKIEFNEEIKNESTHEEKKTIDIQTLIQIDYIEAFKHMRKMKEDEEKYKLEKIKVIVPGAVEIFKTIVSYFQSTKKDKKEETK